MLLALLLGTFAYAAPSPELLKKVLESQPSCQNSVRYDDNNIYLGFGTYRRGVEEPRVKRPGGVKVTSLSDPANPVRLETIDGVIDTLADGNTLFVLTFTAVEVWDLARRERTHVVPTFAPEPLEFMEHARGFARYGDKLIIAHGRLGVSFFNMKTFRITNQLRLLDRYRPRESSAMDVAVSGKNAYVVFDDFTVSNDPGRSAFRGVVVVDMETEKVISELDGMDPGVDAVVTDGKSLIVSFWGLPIWKYSLGDLSSARSLPNPERRLWKFPYRGHPIGKPAMDEAHYYTCFRHNSENRGEPPRFKPVALDRKALMLD